MFGEERSGEKSVVVVAVAASFYGERTPGPNQQLSDKFPGNSLGNPEMFRGITVSLGKENWKILSMIRTFVLICYSSAVIWEQSIGLLVYIQTTNKQTNTVTSIYLAKTVENFGFV